MTAGLPQLVAEPFDAVEAAAITEDLREIGKYAVELVGTFCLLLTVSVAVCVADPVVVVAVGVVLMAMIYMGGRRVGTHFNPAITLAALLWGGMALREATRYWCAQFVAGLCAAVALRVLLSPAQLSNATAMMLSGRTLVAALAAEVLFTFVVSYVVFSCAGRPGGEPNTLSDFAVGVAVVAGAVDVTAMAGDVYLVSQVVAGALAAIVYLTFGSASG